MGPLDTGEKISWSQAFFEYTPVVSTGYGIAKLAVNLLSGKKSGQEPSGLMEEPVRLKPLPGRTKHWSENKRLSLALLPVIGNIMLYKHDQAVLKEREERARERDSQFDWNKYA